MPGAKSPTAARENATRNRILRAATKIHSSAGLDAMTVRNVSARSGVTAPTIYWHFESMDGLLREVIDGAFQQLLVALASAPATGSAAARLVATVRVYRDFGLRQQRAYHTMFVIPHGAKGLLRNSADAPGVRAFNHLALITAEFLLEQRVTGIGARDASISLWSYVHGMVSLQIAGRLGMDAAQFDHFFDDSLTTFLRGLERR